MNEILKYLISRALYLLWMVLCILGAALLSISILDLTDFVDTLLSLIFILILPLLYQFGVDHFSFEEASNMFEWEVEKDEEDEE